MKHKIKLFGIIALIAVIGFFMTACPPESEVDSTPAPTIALSLNTWTQDNLATSSSAVWYKFDVVNGTTYYVWVMEYWFNSVDVADGYADVMISAHYGSQTGTSIFAKSENGANNTTNAYPERLPTDANYWPPSNFTATQTGTVYLKVEATNGIGIKTGHFKVAVTTTNTRLQGEKDMTIGRWYQGNLPNTNSETWHTFAVESGTTYYVWVKEYWSNSVVVADGYADVVFVARYTSKTGTIAIEETNNGAFSTSTSASNPHWPASSFTSNAGDTMYLRVYPDPALPIKGIYKVAVTTTAARPSGE
ncbi:MAG: hypothetical protein LBU88_09310 [Treponema sp.]|jgi:hypothetical protein|nr:hypothetical protein [Treponema sp.]